jgi:hypothetical protein
MIKRLFLFALVVFMMTFNVTGQTFTKGTNVWNVNLSYDYALKSGYSGIIGVQPEFGRYFTDQCYVGLGTGIMTSDKMDSWAIPLFLRTEFDFSTTGSLTPYFSIQGGYDISSSSGSGRVNPSFGVKIPWTSNTTLNIGFGYTHTFSDGSGADYLGLKAGVTFASKGKDSPIVKFFKRMEYGFELETYTSVSSTQENAGYEKTTKYSSIFGARYTMLYPIGSHVACGLTLGGGFYDETGHDSWGYTQDWGKTWYLDLTIRGKYKMTQLAIMKNKLYPIVQLDLGYAPWLCFTTGDVNADFQLNPAVGLAYKVGKEGVFDLTLGYSSISVDGFMEEESKGALRVALGYSF